MVYMENVRVRSGFDKPCYFPEKRMRKWTDPGEIEDIHKLAQSGVTCISHDHCVCGWELKLP